MDPNSKGVVPVAILSSTSFDATIVDPLSVKFGPGTATEIQNKGHIEDVDGDGDLDLVLHFAAQVTGIKQGDVSASLTGKTFSGQDIQGSDAIVTVGGNSTLSLLGEILTLQKDLELPPGFALHQNYPNPFNSSTNIRYTIPTAGHVLLKVYAVMGQEGAMLVD